MKQLLFLLTLLISGLSYSQVRIDAAHTHQTIYSCDTTIVDSGGDGTGPSFFYDYGEDDTVTICSNHPGYFIRARFKDPTVPGTFFKLADGDFLRIYDGKTTSNNILGTFTLDGATTAKPILDTVQASFSNTSGCLTFWFHSDLDKNEKGFLASISCFEPCQAFTVNPTFNGAAPTPTPIKLCKNDVVQFHANGVYPYSAPAFHGATYPSPPYSQTTYVDSLYPQNDNNVESFTWKIDGKNGATPSTVTGQDPPAYVFNTPGIYHVSVEIKDHHPDNRKCYSSNYVEQVYWVATTPIFHDSITGDQTRPETDTICYGESVRLFALSRSPSTDDDCALLPGDPVFIPDFGPVTGDTYKSTINVKCYSNQVIGASSINSVCLNMEHSTIGDLEIVLRCPSGQSVHLLDFNTTDNTKDQYFGTPNVIPPTGTAPGTGAKYCFTQTATQTINAVAAGYTQQQMIPAGDYLPAGATLDFSPLVGCDINGKWTIELKDNRINDNGWVLDWKLNFAAAPVAATSFKPGLVFDNWEPDNIITPPIYPASWITNTNARGDTITITPTYFGSLLPNPIPATGVDIAYKYKLHNKFPGMCDYDTTVHFWVKPNVDPAFTYTDYTICTNDPAVNATPVFPSGAYTVTPVTGLSVNGSTGAITPSTSTPGGYDVTYTVKKPNCAFPLNSMKHVDINPVPVPTVSSSPSTPICPGDPVVLTGTPDIGTRDYWTDPLRPVTDSVANPYTVNPMATTTYTYTSLVKATGCKDTRNVTVTTTALNNAQFQYTSTFCKDISSVVPAPKNGGTLGTFSFSGPPPATDAGLSIYPTADGSGHVAGEINPMASSPGTYTVTNSSQLNPICPVATSTQTITIKALPIITVSAANNPACSGSQVTLTAVGAGTGGTYSFVPSLPAGGGNGAPFTVTNNTESPVVTTYIVTGNDGTCKNEAVIAVTVNPLPNVNAGLDQSKCVNDLITVSPSPAQSSGATGSGWVTNPPLATGPPPGTATLANSGPRSYVYKWIDPNTSCVNTDTMIITVHALPTPTADPVGPVCVGTPVAFIGKGANVYSWSPIGGSPVGTIDANDPHHQYYTITPTAPSTGTGYGYTITGIDNYGCVGTNTVSFVALPKPVAVITANVSKGYPILNVEFTNGSTDATSYTWNFGNGTPDLITNSQSDQFASYSVAGGYTAKLLASNGVCSDIASAAILVIPITDVVYYGPNIFTPDGDKKNDEFTVVVKNKEGVSLKVYIFNRWGEIVHTIPDVNSTWDGTINGEPASAGVYFYKFEMTGLDGVPTEGQGFVELIR